VGFFVQFADPSNPNVKLALERQMRTVPVVNRELVAAMVGDTPVYQVRTFSLTEPGMFHGATKVTTSCTPAVIITGSPDAIADPKQAADQRAMIDQIKAAPDAAFLPKGHVADLVASAPVVPVPVLQEMFLAYDAARKNADGPGQ